MNLATWEGACALNRPSNPPEWARSYSRCPTVANYGYGYGWGAGSGIPDGAGADSGSGVGCGEYESEAILWLAYGEILSDGDGWGTVSELDR